MLEWLLAPIDAARGHDVGGVVAWHARLMVLGWGVLIPLGIVLARYFKILPGQDWPRALDNKLWWHGHRTLQYSGGVLMLVALLLIFNKPGVPAFGGPHALLGWSVTALAAIQFLSGWLRGSKGGPTAPAADGSLAGDHYDMTPRRILFERLHKTLGYIAAALAVAAILSGLWIANAPKWIWLVLGLWWPSCVAGFIVLQRKGMAIDTYQAIWGPDPEHPGHGVTPIGLGIRRLGPNEKPFSGQDPR